MNWILPTCALGAIAGVGQALMRAGGRGATIGALMSARGLADHSLWWAGIAVSWTCGLAWAWLVTRVRLTGALPLFTAVAYITAVALSAALLGERMSGREAAGFACIICGIAVIAG